MTVSFACGYSQPFRFRTAQNCGKNEFGVNRHIVYAMRSSGLGYSAIERFTSFKNMPRSRNNYDKITRQWTEAEQSMQDATKEICIPNGDGNVIADTVVTNDGVWQQKGHSSFNGLVATFSVGKGKILDAEVMSRLCKFCKQYEKIRLLHPIVYDLWKAPHKCSCNYTGSAPNMELVGTLNIFGRSVVKNKLRYTDFYGRSDSKSYKVMNIFAVVLKCKSLSVTETFRNVWVIVFGN